MATENLLKCPCCGFPTLSERSCWEICRICWWEDDGQDDPRADEVWGGPNKHYSLTAARQNFKNHLHKYDRGHGSSVVENPSPRRNEFLRYVRLILDGKEPLDESKLQSLVWADRRDRSGEEM